MAIWENLLTVITKSEHMLILWPSNFTLGLYIQHKCIYMYYRMFIAAVLVKDLQTGNKSNVYQQ